MAVIKIYRFEPENRKNNSWQQFMINQTTLPCFDDDLSYLLSEVHKLSYFKRKKWLFAFTKEQLVMVSRKVKNALQWCTIPTPKWNITDKLQIIYIKEKHVIIMPDQVIYYQDDIVEM